MEEIEQEQAVSFLCLPKYHDSRQFDIICTDSVTDCINREINDVPLIATLVLNAEIDSTDTSGVYKLKEAHPDAAVAGVYVEEVVCNCCQSDTEGDEWVTFFLNFHFSTGSSQEPIQIRFRLSLFLYIICNIAA